MTVALVPRLAASDLFLMNFQRVSVCHVELQSMTVSRLRRHNSAMNVAVSGYVKPKAAVIVVERERL
jgi:hypothetical protein